LKGCHCQAAGRVRDQGSECTTGLLGAEPPTNDRARAYDARAIERILEARFRPRRLAEQIADATRNQIRDAMREHPVEQRALSSYETLRLGDGSLREPREEDARDETSDETEPR